MKLTAYGAWYRQLVSRTWHDRKVPEPHMIRHLDAQSVVYCDPDRLFRPSWCDCIVDENLLTHLPYQIAVKNQPGYNRFTPSMQEIWCDAHVGMRDRDWLYVGNDTWRFRSESDATLFQLTWS
jgi:hypothetical protein